MMKTTFAALLAAAVLATSGPGHAATKKEEDCSLQGAVIGAIQQARLAGVRKAKLRDTVAAAQPGLSEAVLDTVPQLGDFVYDIKKRDLKAVDLGAATRQQCLDNWDKIEKMRKQLN